jgi:hypothetical protein
MIGTSMMGDLSGGFGGLDLDKSPGDVGVTTNEKGDVIYDPYAAQSIDKTKRTFTPVTAGMSRWDVPAGLTVSPGIPTSSPTFRQKRQTGERPVFDWVRGRMQTNRAARQSAREKGQRPVLKWLMNTAGIMNPALRLPMAAYQTAQSLKGIRSLSPAQRKQRLAMNFMGGPLSKMFGPKASALGGIMALRQGAPKKNIFANMLVGASPFRHRDVAKGIGKMITNDDYGFGQAAFDVGMSRMGRHLTQKVGRSLYGRGMDPRFIPTATSEIVKRMMMVPTNLRPKESGPGKS